MTEGFVNLLDNLIIVIIAVGICQEKMVKEKRWCVVAGLLYLMAGVIYMVPVVRTKGHPVGLLLSTIAYMIFIRRNGIKKIAVYLFSFYYSEVCYGLMNLIIKMMILLCPRLASVSRILTTFLVLLCILFFSYHIKKREKWVKCFEGIPSTYYFIAFFCAFIVAGLAVYIEINLEGENAKMQFFGMILITITESVFHIMGISIAVTNLFRKEYKKQNLLKDEYLQLSKQHLESLSSNMKEIRGLRHDMKAHLNSVSYFIEKQEWERLKGYIEEIGGEIVKNQKTLVDVNHDLVNAILAENLRGENDIDFQCEGIFPNNLKIEDFTLCTIFSNLISNSIEACKQLDNVNKEIVLQIKRFQNNLWIHIENPVKNSLKIEELEKGTTKKDKINHGYGINNIITAVKKYNGEVTFQCENYKFSVEILFCDVLK